MPSLITKHKKSFNKESKPIIGEASKTTIRQVIEMVQLMARCQFTPEEYYTYNFYKAEKSYKEMMNYLSYFYLTHYYQPALIDNEWEVVFRNKLIFNSFYQGYGFPVTNIYGYFRPDSGFVANRIPSASFKQLNELLLDTRPSSFVIKPLKGKQGKNIFIVKNVFYGKDEVLGFLVGDKKIAYNELDSLVFKTTSGNNATGFLLEELIPQHQQVDQIYRHSLNTIRVITLLTKDNSPEILFAVLRLGRNRAMIDNSSRGGMMVPIDIMDGTLGEGLISKEYNTTIYTKHPDTDFTFTGMKIPYWEQVKQLCENAAMVAPFCRSVGWDVAITPNGPVLIEGNERHYIQLQALFGGYLQPKVREILTQYGLSFSEDKLPPINIFSAGRAIIRWGKQRFL